MRLVANLIKGMGAVEATNRLPFLNKGAAGEVNLTLKSALGIVKEKDLEADKFYVSRILCDLGPRLKRRIMNSRGRAAQVQKKMCHLTIIISDEKQNDQKIKNKDTKKHQNKKNNQEKIISDSVKSKPSINKPKKPVKN